MDPGIIRKLLGKLILQYREANNVEEHSSSWLVFKPKLG